MPDQNVSHPPADEPAGDADPFAPRPPMSAEDAERHVSDMAREHLEWERLEREEGETPADAPRGPGAELDAWNRRMSDTERLLDDVVALLLQDLPEWPANAVEVCEQLPWRVQTLEYAAVHTWTDGVLSDVYNRLACAARLALAVGLRIGQMDAGERQSILDSGPACARESWWSTRTGTPGRSSRPTREAHGYASQASHTRRSRVPTAVCASPGTARMASR